MTFATASNLQENKPKFLDSLDAISEEYDGFIIDLWGVLHDGNQLFPWVKESLEKLKSQGKQITFLSNSPRRANHIQEDLLRKGLSSALIDYVHSSGEETFLSLSEKTMLRQSLGKSCLAIGYMGQDDDVLIPLGFTPTQTPESADFICVFRPDHSQYSLEYFPEVAKDFIEKGKSLLCPNPDIYAIHHGKKILCSGAYAQAYKALGGHVLMYGKPFQGIYNRILQIFAQWNINRERILCIGDLLETDILGAQGVGLSNALVMSGVHGYNLGILNQAITQDSQALILDLCQAEKTYPRFVLSKVA